MSNVKPKIIVILGPTASGKSALAIKLAQEFQGEIISADSRQIYRQMDLGTGKVERDLPCLDPLKDPYISEGITHHLIDVADPQKDFNISHFKTLAEKAIAEILAKGKLPIICGGTGFWIQAVVNDVILPKVAPNEALRAELSPLSTEELFLKLQQVDPLRAQAIDAKNKVRLIRALEICAALGKVPVPEKDKKAAAKYNFLQIGIQTEREELNKKIKRRLKERFEQGMIKEVQNLQKNGLSWERLESFGLEYRRIAQFLQKKLSEKEMKQLLYFDIIHYAKRQMTWFKRDPRIKWITDYATAKNEVEKFLA